MPKPKKRRLDALDIESVEALRKSRGWLLIRERILGTRLSYVGLLIQANEMDRSQWLRGAISTWDAALEIPDILIAEAKQHHGLAQKDSEETPI
jgi:hypothetical protein